MIRGESVTLASLEPEDSDALFEWINDRELVVLNAPFQPVERADHDRWFEAVREAPGSEIFAIRLNDRERLIGTCQLRSIDTAGGRCELQIRIGDRDSWGRGYGTEAVELLLAHAFDDLGLSAVELDVFATNARAIRAYGKAGFTRTGLRPGDVVIEGVETDVVEMRAERKGDVGG